MIASVLTTALESGSIPAQADLARTAALCNQVGFVTL